MTVVHVSIALARLSEAKPAIAVTESRRAIELARETKDLDNFWYAHLVLAESLRQARDPNWRDARDQAAKALKDWRTAHGDETVNGTLRRPAVAKRVRRVESLQ